MIHEIDFEKALNPLQLRVVRQADGYALVLAGAGSGKTRVLVYRLAYLIQQRVPAHNIVLITFTNKASHEMLSRAAHLVGRDHHGLWGGTFHHIANRILRREATHIGFSSDFTILDREDSKDAVDECIKKIVLTKDPAFPKKDLVCQLIGLAVNSQQDVGSIVYQRYEYLREFVPALEKIAQMYKEKKIKANLMDFDDLLYYWHQALLQPPIQEKYSQLFRYVLVDEHQDTNRLQFEILKLLSITHKNLLAVGDDAQSIYSFRAADINNILSFPKVFPGAKIFPLTINYRSTPEILDLANQSISHNSRQFPKELSAVRESWRKPEVIKTYDVYQQAEWCVQKIETLLQSGVSFQHMAVLFRSRYQVVELEMALVKRGIAYIVRGGVRFFEQAHVKDVLAYLKMRGNPKDEVAFKRVMKMQKGISSGYAEKIWQQVAAGASYDEVNRSLPARAREGFGRFLGVVKQIEALEDPAQIIANVIDVFYREYGKLNFEDYQERMMELEELIKVSEKFDSLTSFLSDLSAYEGFKGEKVDDPHATNEALILSTIHQAKGLEWDTVFILGCAQGAFPNPKCVEEDLLEEERRLFYVAVTRAKNRLFILYPVLRYTSSGGLFFGKASPFLEELPTSVYTAQDYSAKYNSAAF